MARIGIDIDGVCYDFVGSYLDHIGRDRKDLKLDEWEFFHELGQTREQFLAACSDGLRAGVIFGGERVLPGACSGIYGLIKAGHEITFITDRASLDPTRVQRIRDMTHKWLERVGLGDIPVIFDGDKGKVAKQLDLDYFLDDKIENCWDVANQGVRVALLDQPWNRRKPSAPCIPYQRVFSWSGFVGWVEQRESFYKPLVPQWVKDDIEKELNRESVLDKLLDKAEAQEEVRITSPTGGQKGQKLARFDLIPMNALWKVAELYGKGSEKYDDHNWRKGYNYSLSMASLLRHYADWSEGQRFDKETGCHQLAAVIFHCLTLMTFEEEHPEMDDRFCAQREEDVA